MTERKTVFLAGLLAVLLLVLAACAPGREDAAAASPAPALTSTPAPAPVPAITPAASPVPPPETPAPTEAPIGADLEQMKASWGIGLLGRSAGEIAALQGSPVEAWEDAGGMYGYEYYWDEPNHMEYLFAPDPSANRVSGHSVCEGVLTSLDACGPFAGRSPDAILSALSAAFSTEFVWDAYEEEEDYRYIARVRSGYPWLSVCIFAHADGSFDSSCGIQFTSLSAIYMSGLESYLSRLGLCAADIRQSSPASPAEEWEYLGWDRGSPCFRDNAWGITYWFPALGTENDGRPSEYLADDRPCCSIAFPYSLLYDAPLGMTQEDLEGIWGQSFEPSSDDSDNPFLYTELDDGRQVWIDCDEQGALLADGYIMVIGKGVLDRFYASAEQGV